MKENKTKLRGLCVLSVLCVLNSGFGKITEGNKLYEKGDYDEALKKYTDAQIDRPESPELYYNIANILYKQRKYSETEQMLEKAIPQSDTALEAKIYYNIGNSKYRQGQLRESLDYYKKALELNPDDEDAKYNIEFVERMIKEMMSQSKERQEKQTIEDTEKKEGTPKEQALTGQAEEKTEQETQAVEEKAAGETQPEEEKTGEEKKAEELSKEEAERLLQMMQDEEKSAGKPEDRARKRPGYYPEVDKPW